MACRMLLPHLPPDQETEKGKEVGSPQQPGELRLPAVHSRAEISLIQYLLTPLRWSVSYTFGLQELHEKSG